MSETQANLRELVEKFPVNKEWGHDKLENVLKGAAGLLDVIKGEWTTEWSEWDQSVRNGITQQLAALSTEPAEGARPNGTCPACGRGPGYVIGSIDESKVLRDPGYEYPVESVASTTVCTPKQVVVPSAEPASEKALGGAARPCPHVTADAYQPCWACRTKGFCAVHKREFLADENCPHCEIARLLEICEVQEKQIAAIRTQRDRSQVPSAEPASEKLREALNWAFHLIEFPLVPDPEDPRQHWKGCPGCKVVWTRDMKHKDDCQYIAARQALTESGKEGGK